MTLPVSGPLSLKDIGVELGITAGQTAALRSMSSTAGKSTPDAVSEFYGYSAGSTIVYDFSDSITWTTNTASDKDGYQSLVFTGREVGDTITLDVDLDFVETSGSVLGVAYYSINSTSSWTTMQSFSSTDSVSRTIPGVDYGDTVRIRLDISIVVSGQGSLTATLTGGSFTSGSGTITASGSTLWQIAVS